MLDPGGGPWLKSRRGVSHAPRGPIPTMSLTVPWGPFGRGGLSAPRCGERLTAGLVTRCGQLETGFYSTVCKLVDVLEGCRIASSSLERVRRDRPAGTAINRHSSVSSPCSPRWLSGSRLHLPPRVRASPHVPLRRRGGHRATTSLAWRSAPCRGEDPGLSVVVLRDTSVVLARGPGLRRCRASDRRRHPRHRATSHR